MNVNPDTIDRPLRADAQRNRRRIIDAATDLFATRGIDITLDDVAAHAGVGVGTVYRRFANKSELIDGIFAQALQDIQDRAEEALHSDDPWTSMVEFFTHMFESMSINRGLGSLVLGSDTGLDRVSAIKVKTEPLFHKIIQRAQEAGDLRHDVSVTDFFPLMRMVGAAAECTAAVEPENWRRYFAIVFDGLRARSDRKDTLPGRPFTHEEISCVKDTLHERHR